MSAATLLGPNLVQTRWVPQNFDKPIENPNAEGLKNLSLYCVKSLLRFVIRPLKQQTIPFDVAHIERGFPPLALPAFSPTWLRQRDGCISSANADQMEVVLHACFNLMP